MVQYRYLPNTNRVVFFYGDDRRPSTFSPGACGKPGKMQVLAGSVRHAVMIIVIVCVLFTKSTVTQRRGRLRVGGTDRFASIVNENFASISSFRCGNRLLRKSETFKPHNPRTQKVHYNCTVALKNGHFF